MNPDEVSSLSWATIASNPFQDMRTSSISCGCATDSVFRVQSLPCCTSETYDYTSTWPWTWGGGREASSPPLRPQLWEEMYATMDTHPYTPIYNPAVL